MLVQAHPDLFFASMIYCSTLRHWVSIAAGMMFCALLLYLNTRPDYRTVEHEEKHVHVVLHGPGWPVAAYDNTATWEAGAVDGRAEWDPKDPGLFRQFEKDDRDARRSVWFPNGAICLLIVVAVIAFVEVTPRLLGLLRCANRR
jgi:hypothetical protein